MKKKVILTSIIIILIGTIIALVFKFDNKNNNIPDNYMVVFHGGSGEITYSTYIYKIDNGQANNGFKYVNTTNTTSSWGSSDISKKITETGVVTWTDECFKVAKNNNAYSYVEFKGKTYTIDEFASMFLMN